MFAATSPTRCLSTPSTENLVGVSTLKVMPSGAVTLTGWLYPRANSSSVGPRRDHAVADADDLKPLLITSGDTGHHVRDQGTRQAVQRLAHPLVIGPGNLQLAILTTRDLDRFRDPMLQCAFRAEDFDQLAVDGHLDAGRNQRPAALPMRDTSLTSSFRHSPDVRDDFAAHAVVVRLPVSQQTLRC